MKVIPLYLCAQFALAVLSGLQIIIVPWFALQEIQLSASWVGFIQAMVLLPNLLLLLLGGVNADRYSASRLLLNTLIVALCVQIFLLVIVWFQLLSIGSLVLYALMIGAVNGFLQPGKDYLVHQLASKEIQSLIAKASISQYLGQGFGFLMAAYIYPRALTLLPLVLLVFVALAYSTLVLLKPKLEKDNDQNMQREEGAVTHSENKLQAILSGFRINWSQPIMRSLLIIAAFNGFFHLGVFIVTLPVLAHDYYRLGVDFYSLLQGAFVLGTVTTALVVVRKKQLDFPGRRLSFSLLYAGVLLLALSAGPTQTGLLFLIFLWGVVVGVSTTMGRSLLQSQCEQAYRGRSISLYQLALFGFSPLGALCAGLVIEQWGMVSLLRISGVASLVFFFISFLSRDLWAIDRLDQDHADTPSQQ